MKGINDYREEGVPVPYRSKIIHQAKGMENSWYYFGLAGQIGFVIAIPIAGGALLGSYIDAKTSSYPIYTITFLFIGIILSFINFFVVIQSILKKKS